MGRWIDVVAKLTAAAALAAAAAVVPAAGTPTLVARAASCPAAPITISDIVNLEGPSPVTCFGGDLLTFRAFIPQPEGLGGTSAYSISPRWLDALSGSWVLLSTGPRDASTVAFVPPALGQCDGPHRATCPFAAYVGRWATVSAHYDGPVAQTCRYATHPPGKGFTKRAAVQECRQKLIVLAVGPDALPATDTNDAPKDDGAGVPIAILWIVAFAVCAVLVTMRTRRERSEGAPPAK
jgi:hypothetical protein